MNKEQIESNMIQTLLDEQVNPVLGKHKGAAEIVKYNRTTKEVSIRLTGGCNGCPGQKNTFMRGIRPFLIANSEGLVEEVVLVV